MVLDLDSLGLPLPALLSPVGGSYPPCSASASGAGELNALRADVGLAFTALAVSQLISPAASGSPCRSTQQHSKREQSAICSFAVCTPTAFYPQVRQIVTVASPRSGGCNSDMHREARQVLRETARGDPAHTFFAGRAEIGDDTP